MMRNNVKRIVAASAALLALLPLASCGGLKEKYDAYDRTGERYDYDLTEYIAIPEYKEIEIPEITYIPTTEEVENARMLKRAYFAKEESVDEGCRKYDLIDAEYSAVVNGVNYGAFDSSVNASRRSFMVGINYFGVKEIDDAILGMKPGDTKTIDFTFPEPYLKDVPNSGNTGTFTITVKKVRRQDFPEYTDDFVNEFYGFDSVDEYDAEIIEQLTHDAALGYEGYESSVAWNYLFGNARLYKYPGKELNEARDSVMNLVKANADAGNMTVDEYVKSMGYEDNNDFYDNFVELYARDYVKEEMILYVIIRCEGIALTEAEYQSEMLNYCAYYEVTDLDSCRMIIANDFGSEAKFRESVLMNKAREFIGSSAVKIDPAEYYRKLHAGEYEVSDDEIAKINGSSGGDTAAIAAIAIVSAAVLCVIIVLTVKISKGKKRGVTDKGAKK